MQLFVSLAHMYIMYIKLLLHIYGTFLNHNFNVRVFGKQTKSHEKITTTNKNTPQKNTKARQRNPCPISAKRTEWLKSSPYPHINYRNKMTVHGSSNYWLFLLDIPCKLPTKILPPKARFFNQTVSAPKHVVQISAKGERTSSLFSEFSLVRTAAGDTQIFKAYHRGHSIKNTLHNKYILRPFLPCKLIKSF